MNNNQYGKKNSNYKRGKYCKDNKNYCIDCGKEISLQSIRCRKCAGKQHSKRMRGKENPNYGNPFNMRGKTHARYTTGHYITKNYCPDCGIEIHPDAIRCSSCANSKEKNPNWVDGRSNFPYPLEFNDKLKTKIRKRDNLTCQKCGITEEEHLIIKKRKLDVHHIDYNRENCKENNLITLCNECNNLVNKNKKHWKRVFKEKLLERRRK